jgi:hypothetical protein
MNPAGANTSKDAAAYPAAAAAAAAAASAAAEPAPESRMSLKERMALLQQQEKKDDDRPLTNAGADRRTSSEGRNVDALLESTCFRDLSNQSSNQMRDARDADANRILQIAANRRSEQPENAHFRNSATISKLSVQAREVAEALGGLPPEEEEVEEKEVAGELLYIYMYVHVYVYVYIKGLGGLPPEEEVEVKEVAGELHTQFFLENTVYALASSYRCMRPYATSV